MTGGGKIAVVTGGGSGIGRAIAERLTKDGITVAVLDLDPDAADEVAGAIGGLGVGVDVSDRSAVEAAVGRVRDELGPVTVLVNNAGVPYFGRFLDVTLEAWEKVLTVNLTGTFHVTQVVLPDMVEAGWGRIVNISSSSAQGGQQLMAPYVSSKAGMIGLTKSLALEFGPKGITVNTIPPGFIDTPMLRDSESKGLLGGSVEDNAAKTPVRRAGTAEDIAAAAAFLVSDDAGYVTGQVIGVNGGRNT
jgi:NAD(P)-dependent dehydrogenase (short-subunit alcohol dehydrogenase family)